MRGIFAILLIIGSVALQASAQSESDVKKYFEGKHVTFRIDMPATKEGVEVYPERSQALDYNQYNERLKKHGTSIQRGAVATVTRLRIKDKQIEVQFADSQRHSSRFGIHFARVESWMLTPATLLDALNRYVEFSNADKISAQLRPSSDFAAGYLRNGVIHLGPRTTYLKEGLKTQEVLRLLGEPSAVSELDEAGRVVATYEFQRGEGRVLIAEFMGGVLMTSRTETRSVAVVNPTSSVSNP